MCGIFFDFRVFRGNFSVKNLGNTMKTVFTEVADSVDEITDYGVKVVRTDTELMYTIYWRNRTGVPYQGLVDIEKFLNIPSADLIEFDEKPDLNRMLQVDPLEMILPEIFQIVVLASYLLYAIRIAKVSVFALRVFYFRILCSGYNERKR